ncbi:hypothetical protein B0T26DRAFT_802364 [Lasiosphaeria miniovina]|uniref:Uncharacterized protein n=1 Tax=Lasiosphaeria miniovina TaxID=1954250 RepID=A0AA40DUR6_9PEZI|nr:uncharacterized protein B0T26DRAFT_802364 [Lasiosphaeria miniovina]KAK0717139.1 hypothetical protein B0T26DRAFT_802364 [Lasiosphaeria miniovina]
MGHAAKEACLSEMWMCVQEIVPATLPLQAETRSSHRLGCKPMRYRAVISTISGWVKAFLLLAGPRRGSRREVGSQVQKEETCISRSQLIGTLIATGSATAPRRRPAFASSGAGSAKGAEGDDIDYRRPAYQYVWPEPDAPVDLGNFEFGTDGGRGPSIDQEENKMSDKPNGGL